MEPFLGQVILCGLAFAPAGWADCNGQLLPVQGNQALFALLGTAFGGDGKINFALPDLRSRVAVSMGARPGGTAYKRGDQTGVGAIAISAAGMAAHGHGMNASPVPGAGEGSGKAIGNSFATLPSGRGASGQMYAPGPATTRLSPQAVQSAGSNGTHSNLQPSLALRYIIATTGIFPQRP